VVFITRLVPAVWKGFSSLVFTVKSTTFRNVINYLKVDTV